jgi:hypothetical protein
MPSTYTTNGGIELPANGEQSGTWGETVNDNMSIIDRLTNGVGSISLSGTTHTLTTTDGTLSDGQYNVLVLGGSPSGTNTITISPNDGEHVYIVKNISGQTATFTQGSGASISVLNNTTKIIYADGAGAGAAVVDITGALDLGSLIIAGTTTITAVLDEDNMASDSATALATQQSIKAYVDAQVDTVDTLAEILAIGNTTGATDIAVDSAQKVQFRDAAIYINSSVDGQLDIVADTEIQIAATTIDLNGALDVSGTALVTGVLTTTAATVFNGGFASNADSTLGGSLTVNGPRVLVQRANDDSSIAFANNASGSPSSHVWATGLNYSNSNAFSIAYGSGGIPSLDDAKLVIDVSGNVGIGVTPSAWWSSAKALQIAGTTGFLGFSGSNGNIVTNTYYDGSNYRYLATSTAWLYEQSGGHKWSIAPSGTAGDTFSFTEAMRIDASGNLLVGATSNPSAGKVVIDYARGTSAGMRIKDTVGSGGTGVIADFYNSSNSSVGSITHNSSATAFNTSSDYRLKTDAQPMTGASARVQALNPVNFEWIHQVIVSMVSLHMKHRLLFLSVSLAPKTP